MKTLRIITAVASCILIAIGISSFLRWHDVSKINACIENLRLIVSAKGSFRMVQHLPDNQEIKPSDISLYMKGGWSSRKCPSGGIYLPGLCGGDKDDPGDYPQSPSCSFHGYAKDLFRCNQPPSDLYFTISVVCFLIALIIIVFLLTFRMRSQPSVACDAETRAHEP